MRDETRPSVGRRLSCLIYSRNRSTVDRCRLATLQKNIRISADIVRRVFRILTFASVNRRNNEARARGVRCSVGPRALLFGENNGKLAAKYPWGYADIFTVPADELNGAGSVSTQMRAEMGKHLRVASADSPLRPRPTVSG